jgi:hypothetical protein
MLCKFIHLSFVSVLFFSNFFMPNSIQDIQVNAETLVDLNGNWHFESDSFRSSQDETGCHLGYSGDLPKTPEVIIVHQGNNISIPGKFGGWSNNDGRGRGYGSAANGQVVGNQFTLTSSTPNGFTNYFQGIVSKDGNRISGKMICSHSSGSAKATGSFSFTRQEDHLYITL